MRRRSHDGVSWKPPTIQDSKTGLYCRRCSSRHGYNGFGRMLFGWEFYRGQWTFFWMCPKYKHVLKEVRDGEGGTVRPHVVAGVQEPDRPDRLRPDDRQSEDQPVGTAEARRVRDGAGDASAEVRRDVGGEE